MIFSIFSPFRVFHLSAFFVFPHGSVVAAFFAFPRFSSLLAAPLSPRHSLLEEGGIVMGFTRVFATLSFSLGVRKPGVIEAEHTRGEGSRHRRRNYR
jgi:hypothetical protein